MRRHTVCFVYVNPGRWPSESICVCSCVCVRARVCVDRGPGEKQNEQPGSVMVESGDAGRQFNDSPHP